MRLWIARLIAALGLFVIAALLSRWLAPRGWIAYVIAGAIVFVSLLELAVKALRAHLRERRLWRWHDAWREGPARRDEAIAQAAGALEREPTKARKAQVALVLAELLRAGDQTERAARILAELPVESLGALRGAVVRHARVQLYLQTGDYDEAERVLRVIGGPQARGPHAAGGLGAEPPTRSAEGAGSFGDDTLDTSLDLARASLALARGEVDRALAAARAATERDDALADEGRALEAACLVRKGDRDAARRALEASSDEGRAWARLLAPRVVREALAELEAPAEPAELEGEPEAS